MNLTRGYRYQMNDWSTGHFVVFDRGHRVDGDYVYGDADDKSLDQAICDAAEAALKGEEG